MAAIGGMMKRVRDWGGVYGGGVFLISGRQIERWKKITKIKYDEGLRWLPFDILQATTNPKHMGMTEGGWDRLRGCARTLGEHDGNNKPLSEGNNNDVDKYNKDGDIPDNADNFAIGVDGVNELLDKGNNKYDTLSAAPVQACTESQQPSVPSR